VGQPYSAQISQTGAQGSFSFSAAGLPPGLGISTSGLVSGAATTAGSYSPVVTVTSGASHASRQYSVIGRSRPEYRQRFSFARGRKAELSGALSCIGRVTRLLYQCSQYPARTRRRSPSRGEHRSTPSAEAVSRQLSPAQVTVDGQKADILFTGMTPGVVGLYQIDFTVPLTAKAGNLNIAITQNGVPANVTTLIVAGN
jgi:hypothetical protein